MVGTEFVRPVGIRPKQLHLVASTRRTICGFRQRRGKASGVIGAGPAGLRAAEVAAADGAHVVLCDGQPSAGRKFLVAGRGGLNLTHSEPVENFPARYRAEPERWRELLADFSPDALRAWAEELSVETYVGTSKRVFPRGQKAAVLLRAWLRRLREAGVEFKTGARLTGLTRAASLARSTSRMASICWPAPSCSPWAELPGPRPVPMARGRRCWRRTEWRWRRSSRPIAAGMSIGRPPSRARRRFAAQEPERQRGRRNRLGRTPDYALRTGGRRDLSAWSAAAGNEAAGIADRLQAAGNGERSLAEKRPHRHA